MVFLEKLKKRKNTPYHKPKTVNTLNTYSEKLIKDMEFGNKFL